MYSLSAMWCSECGEARSYQSRSMDGASVGCRPIRKQERCCKMLYEGGCSIGMPAKPRDAATLILLRDSCRHSGGIEVLLLRRHARSAFLPGAYVFPGGVVEETDFAPEMAALCSGLSFDQAHRIIKDVSPPQKSLGFFVAAIRESFEESGILLAHGNAGRRAPGRKADDAVGWIPGQGTCEPTDVCLPGWETRISSWPRTHCTTSPIGSRLRCCRSVSMPGSLSPLLHQARRLLLTARRQ